jgi:hypothetical protein
MPVHSQIQQQATHRLLWSGILAVGILWLLAAFSVGNKAEYSGSDTGRKGVAAVVDMPLHASGEHSLALKRFFNRDKDQPGSAETPDPIWALTHREFLASLSLVAAKQHNPATHSLCICRYQLQTLNVPRAPPLV